MQKTLAFIITFIFLGGALWYLNAHEGLITMLTPKQIDRTVTSQRWDNPPELTIDTAKKYLARMETTKGVMEFELLAKETPKTVNNFVFLARNNFYNNTFFHRIVRGFMIQGGDPSGNGTGSPGYLFSDEPIIKDYERGVLAMANGGPDTNGSQFFVMHQQVDLPKNYVIFGQLVAGEDVLDKIAETPVVNNGAGEISKPTERVYINSVEIVEE